MKYNKKLSFLGLCTGQGQITRGLNFSPRVAWSMLKDFTHHFEKEWIYSFAEHRIIHQQNDLANLDWEFYTNAYFKILDTLSINKIPINWGGDHGVAVSTVAAFAQLYPSGYVLWIDAHADLNTPESTLTGNFHGMPLSILMGLLKSKTPPTLPFYGILDPTKIIYLGLRDLDPYEVKLIEKTKIKHFHYSQLKSKTHLLQAMQSIQQIVGSNPLHISFDIDSLNPQIAPSTGVHSPGGFNTHDLSIIAHQLNQGMNIKSIDITEINPFIGTQEEVETTYQCAIDFLTTLLNLERRDKNDGNNQSIQNLLQTSFVNQPGLWI